MFESKNKTEKKSESAPKNTERQRVLQMTQMHLSDLRKELDSEKDGLVANEKELRTVRAKGTPNEYRKTTKNKHIVWENGDYLKGSVIQGKWTGYGKYTLGENIHYEGNFVNSQFEGKGVYSYGKPDQADYFKLDCEWRAGTPMEKGNLIYIDPNNENEEVTTKLYFIFKWPDGSFYPLKMERWVYESEEVGLEGDPFYIKRSIDGTETIFRRDIITITSGKKLDPSLDDEEVITLPNNLSEDFKQSLLRQMNDYYKTHVKRFHKE